MTLAQISLSASTLNLPTLAIVPVAVATIQSRWSSGSPAKSKSMPFLRPTSNHLCLTPPNGDSEKDIPPAGCHQCNYQQFRHWSHLQHCRTPQYPNCDHHRRPSSIQTDPSAAYICNVQCRSALTQLAAGSDWMSINMLPFYCNLSISSYGHSG